jgi:hypothetical protein
LTSNLWTFCFKYVVHSIATKASKTFSWCACDCNALMRNTKRLIGCDQFLCQLGYMQHSTRTLYERKELLRVHTEYVYTKNSTLIDTIGCNHQSQYMQRHGILIWTPTILKMNLYLPIILKKNKTYQSFAF